MVTDYDWMWGCGGVFRVLLMRNLTKKALNGRFVYMVEQQGFKPWTSALQRRRSNQLSYCPNRIILAEKFEKDK